MHTFPWPLLVASFWLATYFLAPPAHAQERVPLRAAFRGEFLPEGTELVILSKDAQIEKDGRYQPEFVPVDRYPTDRFDGARRDRLTVGGKSSRLHAGTESSGKLYFLYALTPDSLLYWSYSAERDSLKFDVVRTGVMSVAPVYVSDVRRDVLEELFSRRVTVRMPSLSSEDENQEGRGADESDAKGSGPSPSDTDPIAPHGETAHSGTGMQGARTASADDPASHSGSAASELVPHSAGAAPSNPAIGRSNRDSEHVPPVATAARLDTDESSTFGLNTVLILVLVLLSAAAGAAVSARKYRRDVSRLRQEVQALGNRLRSLDRQDRL